LVSYFDLRTKHPKGLPDGVKAERVVGTDDNMLRASIGASRNFQPTCFGSYLRFAGFEASDQVTIEFPIKERTETWTAPAQGQYLLPVKGGTRFTCRFRGNTLIELTPPVLSGSWLYQRRAKKYDAHTTPTIGARR
jgi:hypothetical protein